MRSNVAAPSAVSEMTDAPLDIIDKRTPTLSPGTAQDRQPAFEMATGADVVWPEDDVLAGRSMRHHAMSTKGTRYHRIARSHQDSDGGTFLRTSTQQSHLDTHVQELLDVIDETSGKAQAVREGQSAALASGSELRARSNTGADVQPAEDIEMHRLIQASRPGTGDDHWALDVFTEMSKTTLKPSKEKYVPSRLRDILPL